MSGDPRVLQVLRPAAGGMARHVATLCVHLAERGMTIGVAASASGFPAGLPDGVPRHVAAIPARPSPLGDLRAIAQVVGAARGYDILHGHGLRGAWIAGWAARVRGMPCVATAHNVPIVSRSVRLALRGACVTIAVSEAVRQALVQSGAPGPRTRVVHNGVAISRGIVMRDEARLRLGIPIDAPMVLAAGRLSPEKGMDVLLQAAPAIAGRHPRVVIVIAGDGPEQASLKAQSELLRGRVDVRLLGWVSDPTPLMAACDVVAAPSLSEGEGLTVIEAMALCRPVVASAVGGIPEVVDDGRTGLLVPPDDHMALAQAIVALLGDGERREAMGHAGLRRAQDQYSIGAMIDATRGVYAEAIESRQAKRRPAG